MNKGTPRIRQFRVKMPSSTRHSQELTHEFELFSSPKHRDVSPKHRVTFSRRKREALPSLKERISRAPSILATEEFKEPKDRSISLLRNRCSISETLRNNDELRYPITPAVAIKLFKEELTMFELGEILDYPKVHFLGLGSKKIKATHSFNNNTYDDESGDYLPIIGDHLAYRFETLMLIGKGSFGQVLKCYDHKLKEIVAIKMIKNKKRFHQQAAVELKILDYITKHDADEKHHLIHLQESFVFRKHLCIVFEMLSMNLYEVLKANAFQGLPIAIAKNIASQILVALAFLARHRVIHCDLKPENILMVKQNRSGVKIIDFGSSCFENERLYTYIQSRFYRAPEIILGIPYKTSIDMWSLGCVVAELFVGYPLFPGENEQEQLLCMMEMLGPPPAQMIDGSPKKSRFFNGREPIVVPNSHGRIRTPGSRNINDKLKCNDSEVVDFILSKEYLECLSWDPALRMSPEEALKHPWILCKYR